MSEVMYSHRIDAASSQQSPAAAAGLSVQQVVAHVCRLRQGSPTAFTSTPNMPTTIDTVDACVRLGMRRQLLSAGLDTQEALDCLGQIAAGRASLGHLTPGERHAVEGVQKDMRTRLSHLITDWRRAGDRFTHLTRLLPAQLHSVWPTLPGLDSADRRGLEQAVPAAVRMDFEHMRTGFLSAHRRYARAAHEIEQGREQLRELDARFRAGQCVVVQLAQARLQLQRRVESALHAEADRLVSQHVMLLLARPARVWSLA